MAEKEEQKKTITKKELKERLKKHEKWLTYEEGGERLDLSGYDLRNVNFSCTKLIRAIFRNADLTNVNFCNANLRNANLEGANLEGADFYNANLDGADLSNANASGAEFYIAKLSCASFYNANLRYSDLNNADLSNANLINAYLDGANLDGANLDSTNLSKNEQHRLGKILTRKMIAYKKCKDGVIVKLEIPAGAVVFCINGHKCRTNIAKCIEISDNKKQAVSYYRDTFIYEVGKTYKVKNFNLQYNIECASGIHFFKTLEEAKVY